MSVLYRVMVKSKMEHFSRHLPRECSQIAGDTVELEVHAQPDNLPMLEIHAATSSSTHTLPADVAGLSAFARQPAAQLRENTAADVDVGVLPAHLPVWSDACA
ncbi:hypothetical protein GCM10027081_03680 [Cupriavidus yeoncheonensis]